MEKALFSASDGWYCWPRNIDLDENHESSIEKNVIETSE